MFHTLIFDIDGTLWNATIATANGWTKALAKLNISQTITPEQNASVAGKPNEVCVETLMPGLMAKYPELYETLEAYEKEAIAAKGGTFYPGALESIRELAKTRQIFLVSNCQDWYMEKFLENSGLREIVKGYDCHGMSEVSKGEMLKNMKAKYGLDDGTVYIGDTVGDQKAAHEAGMEFIHAGWGFGKVEEFEVGTKSFAKFQDIVEKIKYRYRLKRDWEPSNPGNFVNFVLLNPSTVDETIDDPTVRACKRIAKNWGYDGIYITNLFAYRATKPEDLKKSDNPIGSENNSYLKEFATKAKTVVVAWGNHGKFKGRDTEVIRILKEIKPLHCIAILENGSPHHPLYAKQTSEPLIFSD